jgi:ubiquinone/menaquinone biosynthesis C-methylase UbiE
MEHRVIVMLDLIRKHVPTCKRVLDMGCGAGDVTMKVAGFARELLGWILITKSYRRQGKKEL